MYKKMIAKLGLLMFIFGANSFMTSLIIVKHDTALSLFSIILCFVGSMLFLFTDD